MQVLTPSGLTFKVDSMYGSVRLQSRALNALCKHIHPLAASSTACMHACVSKCEHTQGAEREIVSVFTVCPCHYLYLVLFDSHSLPIPLSLSSSFHPLRYNSYSAHRAQGSQTEMQRHAYNWECVRVFTLIYFSEA